MNTTHIEKLKKFLRTHTYSTNEVTFYFESDGTIDLLGWNFIPGLKDFLIKEITEILDFVDGNFMKTEITIEYDRFYDIASISYNGCFWCDIEPTE